jgi:hypothetical protein
MITGRTRYSLILPCDWRFLPKLDPACRRCAGCFFVNRKRRWSHQLFRWLTALTDIFIHEYSFAAQHYYPASAHFFWDQHARAGEGGRKPRHHGQAVQLARSESEVRTSFLKKRSKRLLQIQVYVPPEREVTASKKSFGSFLQKRTLPSFAQPLPAPPSWLHPRRHCRVRRHSGPSQDPAFMRLSRSFVPTLKETPAEAQIASATG